jgi:hypothetical protein
VEEKKNILEKKFALRAAKKNILTLVLSEKKILNETKYHNLPPLFKLNGRSLIRDQNKYFDSNYHFRN